jgi:hypothetical protein
MLIVECSLTLCDFLDKQNYSCFYVLVCLNDVMIFEEFLQFVAFKCLSKLSLAFCMRFIVKRNSGSNVKSIYYVVEDFFSMLADVMTYVCTACSWLRELIWNLSLIWVKIEVLRVLNSGIYIVNFTRNKIIWYHMVFIEFI